MRTLVLAVTLSIVTPAVVAAKPDVAALSQTRIDAASRAFASALAAYQTGRGTLDPVVAWSVRWLTAERERPLRGKALARALADHAARLDEVAKIAEDAVKAGVVPTSDRDTVAYYQAEAALWVARGK